MHITQHVHMYMLSMQHMEYLYIFYMCVLYVCIYISVWGYLKTQVIRGHGPFLISRKWREMLMSAECEGAAAHTALPYIYSSTIYLLYIYGPEPA